MDPKSFDLPVQESTSSESVSIKYHSIKLQLLINSCRQNTMEFKGANLENMSEQELFDWFSKTWSSLYMVAMKDVYNYSQNQRDIPPLLRKLSALHSKYVGEPNESYFSKPKAKKTKKEIREPSNGDSQKQKKKQTQETSSISSDTKRRILVINREEGHTMTINVGPNASADTLFEKCETKWNFNYAVKYKYGNRLLKPGTRLNDVSHFCLHQLCNMEFSNR
jgi:hypothetical protein